MTNGCFILLTASIAANCALGYSVYNHEQSKTCHIQVTHTYNGELEMFSPDSELELYVEDLSYQDTDTDNDNDDEGE